MKSKPNRRFWWLLVPLLLVLLYVGGPRPAVPDYSLVMPDLPADAGSLENFIKQQEGSHRLKPDNEARIVWADSATRTSTEYAIVYLHGFSASQEEGNPIHRQIAREFGCNLYLSRLAEHGIDTSEPMVNLTPGKYWESAKQALAIGHRLGRKVILMGTSTGGTNALQLAATFPGLVDALVLMSPNIAINNDKAYLLNKPWGLQMAKLVTGSDHITSKDTRPEYRQYWYSRYPLESTVQLQEMLATTMTPELFGRVKQPLLLLYYYRDPIHQDSVVRVDAMLDMFAKLGTPPGLKSKQAIPGAGDHVMGSWIKSHDLEGVRREIEKFMEGTLKLAPGVQGPDH
jgi:pimeloyl-ACP methyl ester carboxylesterase